MVTEKNRKQKRYGEKLTQELLQQIQSVKHFLKKLWKYKLLLAQTVINALHVNHQLEKKVKLKMYLKAAEVY